MISIVSPGCIPAGEMISALSHLPGITQSCIKQMIAKVTTLETMLTTKSKKSGEISFLSLGLAHYIVGGSGRRWEDKLLRVPGDDGGQPAHHQLNWHHMYQIFME